MLMKCTECGHDVSDKADRCPNCGCPVEEIEKGTKHENNEKMTSINDSENPIIRQLNQKRYEEQWIKRIIAEIDEENKSSSDSYYGQKNRIFCNINGIITDITWIKKAMNKMDAVALEHCKYIWSKDCENDKERIRCMNKYHATPQKVFYNRALGFSVEVRDKCNLSLFVASKFLCKLIDSNYELKEFYGESQTEADEENGRVAASMVRCPYCGSIDVKKIFFGGFAQKQWHCNQCRSDF